MNAQRRTARKPNAFGEAHRVATNPLAAVERQCLLWLASRLPRRVNSDHLTLLALVAMALTGLSYFAARYTRLGLLLAVVGLVINWFGDSLASGSMSGPATASTSITSSTASALPCWSRVSGYPAT